MPWQQSPDDIYAQQGEETCKESMRLLNTPRLQRRTTKNGPRTCASNSSQPDLHFRYCDAMRFCFRSRFNFASMASSFALASSRTFSELPPPPPELSVVVAAADADADAVVVAFALPFVLPLEVDFFCGAAPPSSIPNAESIRSRFRRNDAVPLRLDAASEALLADIDDSDACDASAPIVAASAARFKTCWWNASASVLMADARFEDQCPTPPLPLKATIHRMQVAMSLVPNMASGPTASRATNYTLWERPPSERS